MTSIDLVLLLLYYKPVTFTQTELTCRAMPPTLLSVVRPVHCYVDIALRIIQRFSESNFDS